MALQRALGNRAVVGVLARRVLARDVVKWSNQGPLAPKEIDRLYNKAVNDDDWPLLLGVVNSFAEDKDILFLLRPIQKKGAQALAAAASIAASVPWDADHPVRRALAFLGVESQVGQRARTPRNAGWNLGAANGPSDTVPDGTVTVYEAVTDPRGGRTDHFAVQYKGLNADQTGWLQFIAVEAEAFDAGTGGTGDFQDGSMTGRGQPETIKYGTSTSPNWHLDTVSDSLPFYESADAAGHGGTAIVEYDTPAPPATPGHAATPPVGGQTTMIDRPQPDPVIVGRAWGRGVHRVERRVRCHEYLVRGEDVLYENEMVAQDTYWNSRDVPVRHNKPGRRGSTDKLQPAHHEALIRRRPEFSYFARGT